MIKRVAMISLHECPLASSEGKERGGINVYVYELGKALGHLGWQVDMFTRKQDTVNPDNVRVTKNIRVVHLPAGPATPLPKQQLMNHIDEFSANLIAFIKSNNITYNAIHAHYYYSGLVVKNIIEQLSPTPMFVITFHTLGIMKQLVSRDEKSDDPITRIPSEQALVSSADKIITGSEAGKSYLIAFYQASEKRISVVSPGVDTSLFAPMSKKAARRQIGMPNTKHMILSVGRIDPVKGFDVLLAAVKILLSKKPELENNLCLCIVGGDVGQDKSSWNKELTRLNKLRSTLNLTMAVQFVPPMPQNKLPAYYNAADVVVMPSHYESFGMVALEALACGTPVIATDVTGISPILKSFPKGHIVSANNPLLLSERIKNVLKKRTRNKNLHQEMTSYDWQNVAKTVAQCYLGHAA